MVLIHRYRYEQDCPINSVQGEHDENNLQEIQHPVGMVPIISVVVLVVVAIAMFIDSYLNPHPVKTLHRSSFDVVEKSTLILRGNISAEASFVLSLTDSSSSHQGAIDNTNAITIGLGPHWIEVRIRDCPSPRFYVRFVGHALVAVRLEQETSQNSWKGSFTFPAAGTYELESRWYSCVGDETTWSSLPHPVRLAALGSLSETIPSDALYVDGAWLRYGGEHFGKPNINQYIWSNPRLLGGRGTGNQTIVLDGTAVRIDGTVRSEKGFYSFDDLGNYELVCFMGSRTMYDIRESFLKIRAKLFKNQRPFKFHYYNVTSFVHPDREWTLDTKKRVRKCKHILVSVDEQEIDLSQEQYKEQIQAFIGHLLKLMNDETFPIWVLTLNEPPMSSTMCSNPIIPWTSDHPCNDVLKELFNKKAFPQRVHLLDNTDLTLPQWGGHRENILLVIALRVFVLLGKGVEEWRARNQMGLIDGLHRNGSVEPNFELVPYEGWN